jgi:5-methyltetrahydrofolate--homocysteine methyltransferase
VRDEYEQLRELRAQSKRKPLVPFETARQQPLQLPWDDYAPPVPKRPGLHVFEDFPLPELVACIDWRPFFSAWELKGAWPSILRDPLVGEAATSLHADAVAMLERIVAEKWLTARGVAGFWPARGEGEDVWIEAGDGEQRLPFLRQQRTDTPGEANRCLSDFVAPSGDWLGGFAVAIHGAAGKAAEFEAAHDDYNAILLKALADRLAEAFAERLHQIVRTELWGYAPDEGLSNEQLIAEDYVGIRPAPGYPSCPDHTAKPLLFELLASSKHIDAHLTESLAMTPASAVSGWYFSHPRARYFLVGRIGRDQVEDYAARRGIPVTEAERWLRPSLGYEPED